jgi:hypothetical protein
VGSGVPDKRVAWNDPAWTWNGNWTEAKQGGNSPRIVGKIANGAGADVEFSFAGTAVILIGRYSQSGGRADVYLDAEKAGEINAYIVPRTNDNALWHTYGLRQGPHTLKIVTRDDADPRSKGKDVAICSAVTFRAR